MLKVGHIRHTEDKRGGRRRRLWTWTVWRRDEIIDVVQKLFPYFQFRQEEVKKKLKILIELKERSKDRIYHNWTKQDDEFIKQNLHLPDRELARIIGTTPAAVRRRRLDVLNLPKQKHGLTNK